MEAQRGKPKIEVKELGKVILSGRSFFQLILKVQYVRTGDFSKSPPLQTSRGQHQHHQSDHQLMLTVAAVS